MRQSSLGDANGRGPLTILQGLALGVMCAAGLSWAFPAAAQQPAAPPAFERIAPPMQATEDIPLYPVKPAKGQKTQGEIWDRMFGATTVLRNVTQPSIQPFLPPSDKVTGAAVVILPGGGFNLLGMDVEGWTIARWLADHGVAAFVLKYRTVQTPADETQMMSTLTTSMAALMSDPEKTMAPLAPPAVADAIAAMKLVRARATTLKIDPSRVGMIGFSAGAMATRDVVLSADPAGRPDFFGYVYGPMREVTVPADAPPMFAALALDDPLFGKDGFGIVTAWRRAGRSAELHAYDKGGHGFGAGLPNTTSTMILPEFHAWLYSQGLLRKR